LAAGAGDVAAVTHLVDAQNSLLRALLAAVYQKATSTASATPAIADVRAAWSLLTTLDRVQPQALAQVLRHPYVRAWATRCLEQLRSACAQHDAHLSLRSQGLPSDLGHIGAIAAAAAIRARAQAAFAITVVQSAVHLPTLGRLNLSARQGGLPEDLPETATVNVLNDAVLIEAGPRIWTLSISDLLTGRPRVAATDGEAGEWQPVRTLHAPGLNVALEDTDPYRDCHRSPTAARLADAEFARWQGLFQKAWQEIERRHGSFALELAAGLSTVVPLPDIPDDRDSSTASRHAPGSVALARPADPVALAFQLICGFQKVKLGAMLDLYDLYDPTDDRLFPSPWGEGKQQLEGLLESAYAHLAGLQFWRVRQRVATGAAAESAGQQFVRCQEDTAEVIETLAGSGSLTPLGVSFVNEMSRSALR
jgi:uncharacterized protein